VVPELAFKQGRKSRSNFAGMVVQISLEYAVGAISQGEGCFLIVGIGWGLSMWGKHDVLNQHFLCDLIICP